MRTHVDLRTFAEADAAVQGFLRVLLRVGVGGLGTEQLTRIDPFDPPIALDGHLVPHALVEPEGILRCQAEGFVNGAAVLEQLRDRRVFDAHGVSPAAMSQMTRSSTRRRPSLLPVATSEGAPVPVAS